MDDMLRSWDYLESRTEGAGLSIAGGRNEAIVQSVRCALGVKMSEVERDMRI